jgi:hypothetical protein
MSTSDVPPLRSQPSNTGFTLRIPRVQEWTLGAVVLAAAGVGVWMGTLNTKLEHIEKFVDRAEDGANGIFARLEVIRTTLDFLERSSSQSVKDVKTSPVDIRFVPLPPASVPTQVQGSGSSSSSLETALEFKLIREILEEDRKPEEPKKAADTPPGNDVKPSNSGTGMKQITSTSPPDPPQTTGSDGVKEQWMKDLKDAALNDLNRLRDEVNANKKLSEATRKELRNLIDAQEKRINDIKIATERTP